VLACLLLCLFARSANAADMTAEQLIAKHLEAIGPAAVRAQIKTRDVKAFIDMTIVVGGSGTIRGTALLDSDGKKIHFETDFHNVQYKGEQFIFNGEKTYVAMYEPGSWSPFGYFMHTESDILREGLFGGAMTTGWALLDVPGRKPKLSYDGLKEIEGKKLHEITYKMRHASDMTIKLYFDPETFRHVHSTYTLTRGAGISEGGELASSQQQQTRIKLEESFSDFVSFNGVTLPTTWHMVYSSEREHTLVHAFQVRARRIENDATLDSSVFQPTEVHK
jgi:hypothetical protein